MRVVHPCGALVEHRDRLEAGLTLLEAAGCEVRWDARRAEACWRGYLAGTDAERADELIAALSEPGVDVVWFARGGSGGGRILPQVLEAAARLPPRIVLGFSDATSILNGLASACGWISFHGPVVTSLASEGIDCDLEGTLALLSGADRIPLEYPPAQDLAGRLLGGNLSVLASLIGTPHLPDGENAIWVLEDVGEAPYRLDRALTHLRSAGLFEGSSGVWLGDLGLEQGLATLMQARFTEDLPVSVVGGAPAGHRATLKTLPINGEVRIGPAGVEASSPWVQR